MIGSSRFNRVVGVIRMAVSRIKHRLFVDGGRRLLLSIVGVAIAIALVVTVTGISVGLATNTTVYSSDVDYWIVPESASASTMAVSVGGPAFGAVHPTTEQIENIDGVSKSTPVAINTVRITTTNESEYIVLIGVIASPGMTVSGVDTGHLTPGDPLYANGSYNGTWTGEAILSPAGAELLNASVGEPIQVGTSNRSFTVHSVANASSGSGMMSVPTAVVHLAEAQVLAERTGGDTADQFLVQTTDPRVETQLSQVYPDSKVLARTGGGVQAVSSAELPLAMALGGFLVSVIVGSLFVATAMGMEVTGDRRRFATLSAIGFTGRSQLLLVSVQTIAITLIGGVLGVALGAGSIWLANDLAQKWLTEGPIATFDPLLVPYGIGIAVVMGLFTLPYLAWLTARTPLIARLRG